MTDHNAKYHIFTVIHNGPDCPPRDKPERTEVYLLEPGNCFMGFGSSSSGLVVKGTASLITRYISIHGQSDREENISKLAGLNTWRHLIDRILKGDTLEKGRAILGASTDSENTD